MTALYIDESAADHTNCPAGDIPSKILESGQPTADDMRVRLAATCSVNCGVAHRDLAQLRRDERFADQHLGHLGLRQDRRGVKARRTPAEAACNDRNTGVRGKSVGRCHRPHKLYNGQTGDRGGVNRRCKVVH